MKIRIIFISILFYLIYLCIAFGLSGCLERSYTILEESSEITLAGKTVAIEEVAQQYRPQIWKPVKENQVEPVAMYYEVIDSEQSISIVYHPIWENELVPSEIYNLLYQAYRFINYGLTLKDVAFVQIDVSKITSDISRVLMETKASANTYSTVFQEHLRLELKQVRNEQYQKVITSSDNELLSESAVEITTPRLDLQVVSWNHLLDAFPQGNDRSSFTKQNFALKYLTEAKYKRLKFARRSQGDFKTLESPMNTPIIFFVGVLPLFYFIVIVSDYTRNKNKFPRDLEKEKKQS